MHFTREPIIETIITPKDGYKLVLRPSKGGAEEFFVDMVEVISFGNNSFYRSLEKPKSFVIPAVDYDIVEVREARMVLKTAAIEKVKIAGGKKEEEDKGEKKRKKTRKKRVEKEAQAEETIKEEPKPLEKRSLIPPPPTLISESISRYKEIVPQTSLEEEEAPWEEEDVPSS